MKVLVIVSVLILSVFGANAQFWGPPKHPSFANGKLGAVAADSVNKSFHFLASVSTTISTGVGLAGGAGVGYLWNKWDATNNVWTTTSFVGAIGFANIANNKIGGVGGLIVGIPGTNGTIGIGIGRDFTNGIWVGLGNVVFKFF